MNADLKRVRESTIDDGSTSPMTKKRALDTPSSPKVERNDTSSMDNWEIELEIQRKEAIYRQMLEYRRAYEEEARRADALEAQRKVYEASVQAVEICWTQMVQAVADIMGRQIPESVIDNALQPSLEASSSQSALDKALAARLPQSRQIIKQFVEVASANGITPSVESLQKRCLALQEEKSTLKSSTGSLQAEIASLSESRDQYRKDLARAQRSMDRQRMEHDKAETEWRKGREKTTGTPGPKVNGSGHATPNGKLEEDVKPFANGPTGNDAPAGLLQNTAELEALSASRLQQVQQLHLESTQLKQENDKLRLQVDNPSEAILRSSPWFQVYLHQLSTLHGRFTTAQARHEASERTLDGLRNGNAAFRDTIVADEQRKTEALQQQLAKLNSDLARLRGQRDDMNAELIERRAREAEKMRHGEEMESLAKARQDRITVLQSEVTRLKGELGANSGSKGYLSFLRSDGGLDGDYVANLERRLVDAESQASALQSSSNEATSPDSIRVDLEKAKQALERYETLLGPDVDAAGDAAALAKRLEIMNSNKTKLELKLSETQASTSALYTEVEGLSKLWEGAQATIQSKVFEFRDGEIKMQKLITEKAKADNKYFQAMRAKEAIEAEWRTAQRSVDKQLKLLEKASEVEKHLNGHIAAQEKSLTALKNEAMSLQTQLATTSSERIQSDLRLQAVQSSLSQAQDLLHQRVAEANSEKEARAKLQDEADASARQLKKLKERQEAMNAAGGNTAAGLEAEEERRKLWKILRCSCCEENFKQQVIVKCMHTFCKLCLEQRIASRQRKCPACGIAFAKEDVQTLFWQ